MWERLWEAFGFQNVKGIWAQIFWCVSMDHVGAFVKAFLTNSSQAYCAAQRSVNSPVRTEIPLQCSMLFVRLHGSKITLRWDVIRGKKREGKGRGKVWVTVFSLLQLLKLTNPCWFYLWRLLLLLIIVHFLLQIPKHFLAWTVEVRILQNSK